MRSLKLCKLVQSTEAQLEITQKYKSFNWFGSVMLKLYLDQSVLSAFCFCYCRNFQDLKKQNFYGTFYFLWNPAMKINLQPNGQRIFQSGPPWTNKSLRKYWCRLNLTIYTSFSTLKFWSGLVKVSQGKIGFPSLLRVERLGWEKQINLYCCKKASGSQTKRS